MPAIFRRWGHWQRGHWHLTGQHVLHTWTPTSTSGISWINAFGGVQTHPVQPRSSTAASLRSGRVLTLGESVGLSEACLGFEEHAFRHVGVIHAINVSFQYDKMNGYSYLPQFCSVLIQIDWGISIRNFQIWNICHRVLPWYPSVPQIVVISVWTHGWEPEQIFRVYWYYYKPGVAVSYYVSGPLLLMGMVGNIMFMCHLYIPS